MAGPTSNAEALVLAVHPPAEKFTRVSLFTREHGVITAFQRVSRKANSLQPAVDLFDHAQFLLEAAPQGDAWFVREVQILSRQTALSRTYAHLLLASALTQGVVRNALPQESRDRVWTLLENALGSFCRHDQPELTYFKSLYALVRDEGYPVRQQWMASLTLPDQELVSGLLRSPIEGQTTARAEIIRLLRRFENYLREETDLFVPSTEAL